MRILFLGTPDFAVPVLRALGASRHEVIGVVTVPDKPSGRGQRLRASAVKKAAKKLNLPIYQPTDLQDPNFLTTVEDLDLGLMVVVAFRILPQSLYTIPEHGAINLHASLLPQYRGAAPIQHAIMNGEEETGVTTFFLQPTVDTGDILLQESIPIGEDENAGSVHDRLADVGADVVVKTVNGIADDSITPKPQDDTKASPAPKIHREDCEIFWAQPVRDVHNHIRALSPYPGAFTHWNESQVKVFAGNILHLKSSRKPAGEVLSVGNDTIQIACDPGVYAITELQLAGKKRMSAADFLNGYDLQSGEQLG